MDRWRQDWFGEEWLSREEMAQTEIGELDITLARQVFDSDVYKLLVKHQDPDGRLRKFLEVYPKFTEFIGGRPDWLPEEAPLLPSRND